MVGRSLRLSRRKERLGRDASPHLICLASYILGIRSQIKRMKKILLRTIFDLVTGRA